MKFNLSTLRRTFLENFVTKSFQVILSEISIVRLVRIFSDKGLKISNDIVYPVKPSTENFY